VKYCLLVFISLLFTFFTAAQTIPLQYGAGNTYTYAEKDGITESNIAFVGKDSKGRVYAQAFNGGLYILGNNYYKKIAYPEAAPSVSLLCIREIEGEIFLFGNDYVYLLKADTIQSYFKLPAGLQGIDAAKPTLYFSCVQNNMYKMYGFKNRQFYLIHSSAASIANSHKYTYDTAGNIYRVDYFLNRLDLYKIISSDKTQYLFSVKEDAAYLASFNMFTIDDWYVATGTHLLHYNRDKLTLKIPVNTPTGALNILPGCFLQQSLPGFSTIYTLGSKQKHLFTVPHTDKLTGTGITDSIMQTAYFGTFNKPFRLFPYLKQHPRIFQQSKSAAIHAITQDSKGRIWAGSYEGGISVIDNAGIKEYRETGINYLPNAVAIDKHSYFIADNIDYGLQQFSENGSRKTIKNKITGFYQYVSQDKQRYYFGTNNTECLFTDIASLQKGTPQWIAIDSSKGYKLQNTITITEDKLSRVWMSNSSKGWAIYYPNKKRAVSFLIAQKETDFGFYSSYTDTRGTVWMGSKQKGLLYFNNYNSNEVLPKDIHGIEHPLLVKGKSISQLIQWQKWLVIATEDKMLLMDLDAWYNEHKTIIRYLNPQETGFTAQLEQNTILTDKRDSSIWFATSNMLYQWNIKQWLLLPAFIVKPEIFLQTKKGNISLAEKKQLEVEPTDNSLKLYVSFQSPDNMPRYISVAFIKKGDSLLFDAPSLETRYSYNNLAPGNYELAIQICQSDGSVTIHKYFITIKKFLWQQWWFWLLLSAVFISVIGFFISQRKKRQLAEQRARTTAAELLSFKSQQEKKLANMQVVTLSNQFRPHFILNALNTIGAQMDDKPETETVLSRLGESINLIFSHAQQQKIAHSFADEWSLVKNIIHIHQLMYLKQLQVILPGENVLQQFAAVKLPLGLLQIPVENALLHGLSNKEKGPWQLTIDVNKSNNNLIVTITDNGVGRNKAATLSNYRKHGTGTKNIAGILDIVNANNTDKITIAYKDDVLTTANEMHGTIVIITIPIHLNYEA
jgi:Histidine kinase